MIEQYFDVSTATTLYLLKDALYTVVLENNEGTEERQLGTLIADTAGTVTITYPNIAFYPEDTLLEDNISWSYYFNVTANVLRLSYRDSTSHTSQVTWTVYNGTNGTTVLQTFTSTSSNLTFSFQPVYANMSYYTHLFVQHDLLDYNISQFRTFGDFTTSMGQFQGFTPTEEYNLKKFGSGIFLIIWGFLFSQKHAGVGLGTTFVWVLILKAWGWFPISYLWVSVIGFVAVLAFIVEAMRKN